MRIFAGYRDIGSKDDKAAVGIGIFDGVHRGHQALLKKVVELARADRLSALAYTFHPHPAQVLNPALAPKLIEPVQSRLRRFEALGIEEAVVEPFDRKFASMQADTFVVEVLVKTLHVRHVVVGAGFTFGTKQQGNVALLEHLGQEHGFKVHAIPHVRMAGIEVSSTKVREFITGGQMSGATLLLGRPFVLIGTVVEGARRGATLGFPTANLQAQNEAVPAKGVYAAVAHGAFGTRNAVVNVGYTPTFAGNTNIKIEAHLLDYSGPSFYHTVLSLELLDRLRDEQRFDGPDALRAQIARDIAQAQVIFAGQDVGRTS